MGKLIDNPYLSPETCQLADTSTRLLLGRKSDIDITSRDFAGNSTLLGLSNTGVKRTIERREVIVRRATELPDVVRAVLRVSHRDLSTKQKAELSHLTDALMKYYLEGEINVTYPKTTTAILEVMPEYAGADLMRGMGAFRDAENDQHQGTYEDTIVVPATLLAGWMILTAQTNESFVYVPEPALTI